MQASKIINDPVFGFINIPRGLLYDIVRHPLLQRLNRIKQVGLSSVVWGYVMPLVVLLVVLVGAKMAGVDDGPAAVATLVGVAIYYVGLYLARRRFERVIKFTIIKE